MSNIHKGHRERLKSRFRTEGLDSFCEHEVLELLLMYAIPQKDVNPLAHSLIDEFGSLKAVLEADFGQLLKHGSVGEHTATLLTLIEQAARYAEMKAQSTPSQPMNNSKAAGSYCARLLYRCKEECIGMLCLRGNMSLIRSQIVQKGTFIQAALYPRRIAEIAMRDCAAAVILTHNHPSGALTPSGEDIEATKNISAALEMLGICLADHIIVSGDEYFSMFANKCFTHEEHGYTALKLAVPP